MAGLERAFLRLGKAKAGVWCHRFVGAGVVDVLLAGGIVVVVEVELGEAVAEVGVEAAVELELEVGRVAERATVDAAEPVPESAHPPSTAEAAAEADTQTNPSSKVLAAVKATSALQVEYARAESLVHPTPSVVEDSYFLLQVLVIAVAPGQATRSTQLNQGEIPPFQSGTKYRPHQTHTTVSSGRAIQVKHHQSRQQVKSLLPSKLRVR